MPHKFHEIRQMDTLFDNRPIAYGETHRAAIETAWKASISDNPHLFNGQVLLMTEGQRDGSAFRGRYSPTDYATFLHFMRHGEADGRIRNGFGLAGLVSSDGALLMGVMGAHTVNAGRIYFPGGTPDLSDVVGNRVDLEGSVRRELTEETGLAADEVSFEDGFLLREDDKRCSFVKIVRVPLPADAARALILARLWGQEQPELSDIHIVRDAADPQMDRMPAFQSAFVAWWFAEGHNR